MIGKKHIRISEDHINGLYVINQQMKDYIDK